MVIPVPVNADILSKTESIIGVCVASIITIPPIIAAHNHPSAEIIIPCLRRTFLVEYSLRYLLKNSPKQIDIAAGIAKQAILNSKYTKSKIIGTKHINPIPIIKYPEFIPIINKSVLVIYLILFYLLNIFLYIFISIEKDNIDTMDKKSIFFLGISIVILAVMLGLVGINEVIAALKMANAGLLLLAVGVQVVVFVLYTLRWQILNSLADIDMSFKKLLPMTLVGLAVNNITPSGRGGGEPVRAYILSREGKYPMQDAFATVVADRTLDTFPFIILAIFTVIASTLYFKMAIWLLILMILAVIAIVAILIIIIYMSINPNFGKRVDGWVIGLLRRFYKKNSEELENKVHKMISDFQETMRIVLSSRTVTYYALPLSFIIWILEILRVYIVFLAFGATINPIIIGEVFIIASLVGMVPLLPGGLGAVDGIMVVFYSVAGISASVSAAATVIERLISFWLATIIGMLILPHYGSSILSNSSLLSSDDEIEQSSENECDD